MAVSRRSAAQPLSARTARARPTSSAVRAPASRPSAHLIHSAVPCPNDDFCGTKICFQRDGGRDREPICQPGFLSINDECQQSRQCASGLCRSDRCVEGNASDICGGGQACPTGSASRLRPRAVSFGSPLSRTDICYQGPSGPTCVRSGLERGADCNDSRQCADNRVCACSLDSVCHLSPSASPRVSCCADGHMCYDDLH
jgi:hypothetical protein